MTAPDPAMPSPRHRPEPEGGRAAGEHAEALKERVYAIFTGLAIVLVQRGNVEHLTAAQATLTLLTGIVAITAAGFVAGIVAHLAVHAAFPDRVETRAALRTAGGAIASAAWPLILLVLAWVGVMQLEAALRVGELVYLITLVVIGWIAVRRTRIAWWKQLFALGALVLLGILVVTLQQLAHGH